MSTATQLLARVGEVAVNAVAAVAVLRHLGPAQFGDYVLVLTVVGLSGLFAEIGLPRLAVREVAQGTAAAECVVGTVVGLRLGLCVLAAGVAQALLLLLDVSPVVHLAALVATAGLVAEALLSVCVVFHVALLQQYEAAVRLLGNVVKLVLVLVLVSRDASLVALVAALSASLLVTSALAWSVALRRFQLRPSWDRRLAVRLLRSAVPLAATAVVGVAYLKLDAVMVSLLGTRSDVGIYGAAYQPAEYLFLLSAVVSLVLFPVLAQRSGSDPAAFARTYQVAVDLLVALMLPVAVVLLLAGGPLTRLVYGERFTEAAWPMALLGLAVVLLAVNAWQGFTLLAVGRPDVSVIYLCGGVLVNIALDVVLIPRLGPVGAAWGTLVSGALMLAASTLAVRHVVGVGVRHERLLRLAAAGVLMAGALAGLLSTGLSWPLAVLAALLAYPALLVALRAVTHGELQDVLQRGPADRAVVLP